MEVEALGHLTEADGIIGLLNKPFDSQDLSMMIIDALQQEAQSGIMHHVSPTVFVQIMEMEGKSCTIRVIDNISGEGGILYFSEGKLLDARVGKSTAIEAAYKVFAWDEVTIFLRNECAPRKNVINRELQSVIMEALAAKDELDESEFGSSEGVPVAGSLTGSGDLGLPACLPDLQTGTADHTADSHATFAEIQKIIESELGAKDELEEVSNAENMDSLIDDLNMLGQLAGIGDLKGCSLKNGGRTRLLIPGRPPALLEVKTRFSSRENVENNTGSDVAAVLTPPRHF